MILTAYSRRVVRREMLSLTSSTFRDVARQVMVSGAAPPAAVGHSCVCSERGRGADPRDVPARLCRRRSPQGVRLMDARWLMLAMALPLCACAAIQETGREYVWHVLGKTPPPREAGR